MMRQTARGSKLLTPPELEGTYCGVAEYVGSLEGNGIPAELYAHDARRSAIIPPAI